MKQNPVRLKQQLAPLRQSIIDKPPFKSGTFQLPSSWFSLYYKTTKDGGDVIAKNATFDQLEQLAQACEPANSGYGKENEEEVVVVTATEKKLNSENFSTPIVPDRTDLVKIVRGYFLEGTDSTREIKLELGKLNVYESGSSFFKSHVDTPSPPPDSNKKKKFGSLVIVFPTPHEGGTLHLRHHGQEWTFDSALELTGLRTPTIGYIALSSDLEHEVAPVTSGHRVTLTFNLYFDDDDNSNGLTRPASSSTKKLTTSELPYPLLAVNERTIHTNLEALLEDGEFFAEGGTLGFGLRHVYPVAEGYTFKHIYGLLKGSDAAIYRIFRALGFEPILYLYYEWYSPQDDSVEATIIDKVINIYSDKDEGTDVTKQFYEDDGIVIHREDGPPEDENDYWDNTERLYWVTPVTQINRRVTKYAVYTKDLRIAQVEGDLCLVVRIGKAGERLAYPTVAQLEARRSE
ncbi:hypothetical protein B0F90DRAFT_1643202 [Multifurca ochricompacta]|uniref:Prolyl 4-hydroxylase alpha subunit Fe(2+) 2OG dioxygenase domain-containing protein n=1 Tax=Multifurca ochricompacta TaxID=376703 RepID=A0AAD4LYC4_9AGAM|nr:hypothetical protein B0F90DRAFT_1643202 [Multifurca ochricompacta]